MNEQRQVVREIAWNEVLPGMLLLRVIRLSLSVRNILLGMLGGMLSYWGMMIFYSLFKNRADLANQFGPHELRESFFPFFEISGDIWRAKPIALLWAWEQLTHYWRLMFASAHPWAAFGIFLLVGLWGLMVWAGIGGMIARSAALQLTRRESVSWKHLFRFVRGRWSSYVGACLIPAIGAFFIAVPGIVLGLLARVEWLGVFTVLLMPLGLLGGFVMFVVLMGLALGFPLMFAAISTEGADAFGALSSAFAYLTQKFLRFWVYVVLLCFLSILGSLLVMALRLGLEHCFLWAIQMGRSGFQYGPSGEIVWGPRWGWVVGLRDVWQLSLDAITTGYAYSFFWTASTAIYLLLRFHTDKTELHEAFVPEEQAVFGLPPLATTPPPNGSDPV